MGTRSTKAEMAPLGKKRQLIDSRKVGMKLRIGQFTNND
jgi:hypothetical protein